MIRLLKWGYYLFLARRYTRRAEKWSDLYAINREYMAFTVSELYLADAKRYIRKAEELYQ